MALTQPKGIQQIDGSKFQVYADQDAEKTVVDWGQAAQDLYKVATDERDRRQKLKDDIEQEKLDVLSSADVYADTYQSLGTFVLEGAALPVNAPIVSQACLSEAKPLEMFLPLLVSEPSLVT